MRDYLAMRRHRAHAAAQAHAESQPRPEPPDHPLICADEPALVSDQPGLDALVDRLRRSERFAYDTEFIGETSYFPRLCLVQVATADFVALVDPLPAGLADSDHPPRELALDLTPLWELLADDAVEKVVHAGEVDFEHVVQFIDRPPARVFDTQIAAGFISTDYPLSLENLLSRCLDVQLPKALTFTRWDQRPLSEVHVHYAVDDVRYLLALREALAGRLAELGRTEWAAEEFRALGDVDRYRFDARTVARRLRRMHSVPLRHRRLLLRYVAMCDRIARKRDLPPRSIIRDKLLVDLAREAPRSMDKLRTIRGLPAKVTEAHGNEIVQAAVKARVSRGWRNPPDARRPLPPAQRDRVDEAWRALKHDCEQMQLAVGLVASRKRFGDAATQCLRDGAMPDDHELLTGWRRQVIEPILRTLCDGRGRFGDGGVI